jgi:hypothetical protein
MCQIKIRAVVLLFIVGSLGRLVFNRLPINISSDRGMPAQKQGLKWRGISRYKRGEVQRAVTFRK